MYNSASEYTKNGVEFRYTTNRFILRSHNFTTFDEAKETRRTEARVCVVRIL